MKSDSILSSHKKKTKECMQIEKNPIGCTALGREIETEYPVSQHNLISNTLIQKHSTNDIMKHAYVGMVVSAAVIMIGVDEKCGPS